MTIAVIGLGLIGGSVALDLLDQQVPLIAFDEDQGTRTAANRAGIPTAASVEEACQDAHLVVVAVPPEVTARVVRTSLASASQPVVTDVASVKAAADLDLPHDEPRYVGGHPMAGTERSGWAAARRGMVAGAAWLLTPYDTVDVTALRDVLGLVLDLGARPMILDGEMHDQLVAAVSHVPHLLSFGLHAMASQVAPAAVDLVAGPSYRDMTRVAASDPAFWAQVLSSNHDAVTELVQAFRGWLDDVEAAADSGSLEPLLERARRQVATPRPDQQMIAMEADAVPAALSTMRDLARAGYVVADVRSLPTGEAIEVTMARG